MSPKRTYKIVGYKFLPFIVIFCLTTCRSNNIALRRNQFYYPIDSLTESKRLEIYQVLTINICLYLHAFFAVLEIEIGELSFNINQMDKH